MDPEERTPEDLRILDPLIKETQFMHNRKEMTSTDFQELCRSLCYLELDEFENVFEYGRDFSDVIDIPFNFIEKNFH